MQLYYDDIMHMSGNEHRTAFLEFLIKTRQVHNDIMLCRKPHIIVITTDDIFRMNGQRVSFSVPV